MKRIPKVIRLWQENKKRLEQTDYKCIYCGFDFLSHPSAFGAMTFDHLIPRKHGGKEGTNLVPACRLCNSIKGSKAFMNLEDAKLKIQKLREDYLKMWDYYELKEKIRGK